jgi:hypothetical protein
VNFFPKKIQTDRFKLTREEKMIECHNENVRGLLTCEEEKINIADAKRWLTCEEDGSKIMLKNMQGDAASDICGRG